MTKFLRIEDRRSGPVAILAFGINNAVGQDEWPFDEAQLRSRMQNLDGFEPPCDTSVEKAALAELVRRKQAQPADESEVTT